MFRDAMFHDGAAAGRRLSIVIVFAALLGIFLQIQASLPVPGAGDKGLRLNLADVLLPLAGSFILFTLITRRSHLPQWRIPYGYTWLGVLTLVLALALAHSYVLYGTINGWALTNRFAGWFVLLAYFGLGGWLSVNYGVNARNVFLRSFVVSFLSVLIVLLVLTIAGVYSLTWGTHQLLIQLQGFMGNRSAYAFLAMAVIVFASVPALEGVADRKIVMAARLLWLLLPLTLYYNGSRTFEITVSLLLVFLICWRPRTAARLILIPLIAGALLCAIVNHVHPRPVAVKAQTERTVKVLRSLANDPLALEDARKKIEPNTSEAVRLRVLQDALSLWRTHPLMGTGLGSFLDFSQWKYARTNRIIEIIDCTPLWLLTETGLTGLAVFGGFFLVVLYSLAKAIRTNEGEERTFLESALLLLACFALMTLLQELLYTRFLWVVMGMALTKPNGTTESA